MAARRAPSRPRGARQPARSVRAVTGAHRSVLPPSCRPRSRPGAAATDGTAPAARPPAPAPPPPTARLDQLERHRSRTEDPRPALVADGIVHRAGLEDAEHAT